MRVKILFNKKENALVQMSDGTQAQLGTPRSSLPLSLPAKKRSQFLHDEGRGSVNLVVTRALAFPQL